MSVQYYPPISGCSNKPLGAFLAVQKCKSFCVQRQQLCEYCVVTGVVVAATYTTIDIDREAHKERKKDQDQEVNTAACSVFNAQYILGHILCVCVCVCVFAKMSV